MNEEFVGERIDLAPEAFELGQALAGGPALPRRFRWRGEERVIEEVLETWKVMGPCWSGSDEQYVRKHFFRVRTADGLEMKIYFERQPRSVRQRKQRWWLYTVRPADG